MEPPISVPRQSLAELLRASGSHLTPEQYMASLTQIPTAAFKNYPSRAFVSFWSKTVLLIAAILSGIWVCLPFGFSIEDVLVTIALGVITFFEYRVHRYFRDLNPLAPLIGYRNQSALAICILIYGFFHAFAPFEVPAEFQGMIDASTLAQVRSVIRGGYVAIGVLGGISQYGLAWYYWLAHRDE